VSLIRRREEEGGGAAKNLPYAKKHDETQQVRSNGEKFNGSGLALKRLVRERTGKEPSFAEGRSLQENQL